MAGPLLDKNDKPFSYRRTPMSDINVTPFVDVILVLLIVFMVTAPMMTQGVDVQLPEEETAPMTDAQEPLQVSIKSDGSLYIQKREVPLDVLPARLKAITELKPDTMIVIRADKRVDYGQVMNVMAALQAAGLVNVGLITQPQSQ